MTAADLGQETPATARRLWLWQGLCGALVVLWLFTLAFYTFRGSLIEGQYFVALRGDLLAAVQSLAQQQQSLAQRLQALEGK